MRKRHAQAGLAMATLIAAACGCARRADDGELFRRAAAGLPSAGKSYGAAVADLDGDGWPDLLLSLHGDHPELRLNRGGLRFVPPPPGAALPSGPRDQHAAAPCDFDGDGDVDLWIAGGSERGTDLGWCQFWVQRGPLRFSDVAAGDPLIGNPTGRGRGALWADFDGDARPELLLLNYQSAVRLLAFDGRAWRDATDRLPTPAAVQLWSPGRAPPGPEERARSAWVHAAVATDLDGDGRTDLLALGRPGFCGLWWNDGTRLRDLTAASGLKPALWPHVPVHAAAGDVDGDGDADLILLHRPDPQVEPRRPAVELWLNVSTPGLPRFVCAGATAGLDCDGDPAAALLADFDNDGALDLYVVRRAPADGRLARIWRGDGAGHFVDVGGRWGGGGPAGSHPESVLAADLDRDGDLDLLTGNGGGEAPLPRDAFVLYRNRSRDRRGVTLELVAANGAAQALGATAELRLDGRRQHRRVDSVATPLGGAILPLHFGVGAAVGPFTVDVAWPSGRAQRVILPRAGAAYRLREGDGAVAALPAQRREATR
ncbi:MAG: CRTAC1 family protein [Candidatus Krumholzibacteriia bacterium]